MNKKISSLPIVILFILSACHTSQKLNKAIEPKETTTVINKDVEDSIRMVNATFEEFKSHIIDFKTFSAKIKVESYGNNGKNPDITAVIKMVKDSAIWMSLSATLLNVELYRVLITSDSVILLNKQQKEVQFRSLDYLQDVTQIPFDFKTLQDLIIGNPIFLGDSVISYRKINDQILISTIDQYFKNLITITSDKRKMLHSKMDDIDMNRSRTADITYGDYEENGINLFSKNREIVASEKNKINLILNFKQYEFNKELSLIFNIPRNYIHK
jgi:hypothetical protein